MFGFTGWVIVGGLDIGVGLLRGRLDIGVRLLRGGLDIGVFHILLRYFWRIALIIMRRWLDRIIDILFFLLFDLWLTFFHFNHLFRLLWFFLLDLRLQLIVNCCWIDYYFLSSIFSLLLQKLYVKLDRSLPISCKIRRSTCHLPFLNIFVFIKGYHHLLTLYRHVLVLCYEKSILKGWKVLKFLKWYLGVLIELFRVPDLFSMDEEKDTIIRCDAHFPFFLNNRVGNPTIFYGMGWQILFYFIL